ncbi:unnamed protein product, partial [Rotaria socialis]
YECSALVQFNDSNLPEGLCESILSQIRLCKVNVAIGWGVGGDYMTEYPPEAGYPIGGDFEIKYYMIETHFNNPNRISNINGSSGIRFYLGDQLRQYDIGYLTFGTDIQPDALAIPPYAQNFNVDSFCPKSVTMNIPNSGISIISAFPHAHLQGRSIWTKIIRNTTAVKYLINAESFNFNYQLQTRFTQPIILYSGDEFVTRCVYNTMNKTQVTLGGESVHNEMCLNMFAYYPRMENFSVCLNSILTSSWSTLMQNNASSTFDYGQFMQWLMNIQWTPQITTQWQAFYKNASRLIIYGRAENLRYNTLYPLLQYKDLEQKQCNQTSTFNHAAYPVSNISTILFLMIHLMILKI